MSIKVSNKVVLVTGAAGFIGSHVSDVLLQRGDRVIAVDEINDYYDVRLKEANLSYLTEKFGKESFQVYKGDICDMAFMKQIFEKEKPTHICHLAARAGVRPSIADPYIYVHSNIEGTTRLLDLARQYSCKNFVYASSSSVYGSSTNELLSEEDVVERPVSPYAATKKACELLAYTFHHLYGLNCTGLRFFTVYGPRGRPDMAPFKFIDRVFNGLAIQQYGDGSTSRDYTYIDDIVDGVVRSIDRPLGYEVINLGNGRPFLLRDFIGLVERSVGKQALIEVLPEQPGDVERTCADISKARRLLGYNPQVSFETGIQRTAEWYKVAQSQGLFETEPTPERASMVFNFIVAEATAPHKHHHHHHATHTPQPEDTSNEQSTCEEGETSSYGTASSSTDDEDTACAPSPDDTLVETLVTSTSDLELSSYVEKAPTQLTFRSDRYVHTCPHSTY